MHWPQITMVVILALDTGYLLANHGKTREINGIAATCAALFWAWILYKGGFFS